MGALSGKFGYIGCNPPAQRPARRTLSVMQLHCIPHSAARSLKSARKRVLDYVKLRLLLHRQMSAGISSR